MALFRYSLHLVGSHEKLLVVYSLQSLSQKTLMRQALVLSNHKSKDRLCEPSIGVSHLRILPCLQLAKDRATGEFVAIKFMKVRSPSLIPKDCSTCTAYRQLS